MPFEHNCACGKWGAFGFGKGQGDYVWYCGVCAPIDWEPHTTWEKKMRGVPTRFQKKCHFCDGELDSRLMGIGQWTSGWAIQRMGGGTNSVSMPERANKWAHGQCIERASKGLINQRSMFE